MKVENIELLLDWGEWKHSWRLKKTSNGYVNWDNPENHKIVRDQIENIRKNANRLLGLAQLAECELEDVIRDAIEREEKENE